MEAAKPSVLDPTLATGGGATLGGTVGMTMFGPLGGAVNGAAGAATGSRLPERLRAMVARRAVDGGNMMPAPQWQNSLHEPRLGRDAAGDHVDAAGLLDDPTAERLEAR